MTLLDEPLVHETLLALPGWEGDSHRIWRDVQLSPAVDHELRRQIAVDAGAMGQPYTVEDRGAGTTRFVLGVESGVTERDIALASHISDLAHRLARTEPGVDAIRADAPEVAWNARDAH